MNKLFGVIALSIILSLLNQGYGQPNWPILYETDDEIIMQNSWVAVKLYKSTGGIKSFIQWHSESARELLTDTGYITIRDKRNGNTLKQSEGNLANIDTSSYPSDSVKVVFNINFSQDSAYTVQIKYTLDVQAFRWDAELKIDSSFAREADIDFSFPVIANMEYVLWSRSDAPFKLPIRRTVTYRKKAQNYFWPVTIPAMIMYDDTSDVGLSIVSPFELRKPGLEWQMMDSSFIISNYYLRLGQQHSAKAALYIVPHEGDWRPGFAWMHDKYSAYFDPVSDTVLKGEGWGLILHSWFINKYNGILEDAKDRSVTWVPLYDHMPFAGLYAPPDKDRWIIVQSPMSYDAWARDSAYSSFLHASYDSNRTQIDSLHNYDIQTYIYFQSSESWKAYAYLFYPDYISIGANNETIPAWQYCYLMNPDPDAAPAGAWGKNIISQIDAVLDSYPRINGIFYDRPDYCDYDYAQDDGTTMIDSHPVYMLGFAQEKIRDSILKRIHPPNNPNNNKGIWTNWPTSIEVCKGMDGIQSEDVKVAPYLQYLGITRPLIVASWMADTTPTNTEEKLKTALYTGHFPAILRPDNMSRMNREDSIIVKDIEKRYRPLFAPYKGKKWVLYPHALQLPEGIKGNIFQTPDTDYLVPMVDLDRSSFKVYPETTHDIFRYDIFPRIQAPDSQEIKYCYFLSGDYKGINQDTVYTNNSNEKRTHAHRVSSLIQLTKKPKYEITRISSPVLVRGDSEKFEVKVQNTNYGGKKWYGIVLITPFGQKHDTFSLEHDSTRKVRLNFMVPKNYSLGETTMKVIDSSRVGSVVVVDTIIFTAWVEDLLSFQLQERPFIHSGKWRDTVTISTLSGDTIPFDLVNNANRTLKVTLSGGLEGSGEVKFGTLPFESTQVVDLNPLKDTILFVYIAPDSEVDTVKINAVVNAENDTVYAIRPVEKSMVPDTRNDLFDDDFSSGNMNKWQVIPPQGSWTVHNQIARGDSDRHLALSPHAISTQWTNYKFQVNTKLEGSTDPFIDWYESFIFSRVKDTLNYYRFGIYGVYGTYNGIVLGKVENGAWTQLAYTPFDAKKNVWYNLRVEVIGDSIKGFLDGNQVLCAQDTTFENGGIGIGVPWSSMVTYYDDVVVRRLSR